MPAPHNPSTEKARATRAANIQRRKMEAAAALLFQAGWTVIAPEDEVPFICKKCGARSPIGIGYVADGQTGFPDPDPNCPNDHLRSYR